LIYLIEGENPNGEKGERRSLSPKQKEREISLREKVRGTRMNAIREGKKDDPLTKKIAEKRGEPPIRHLRGIWNFVQGRDKRRHDWREQ